MKLRTAQSNLIIYKQTQGLLEIISNCDYLGGEKKEKREYFISLFWITKRSQFNRLKVSFPFFFPNKTLTSIINYQILYGSTNRHNSRIDKFVAQSISQSRLLQLQQIQRMFLQAFLK